MQSFLMLPETDTGFFHMHQPEILMQQKNNLGTSRGVAKGAAFASASSFFSEAAATEMELVTYSATAGKLALACLMRHTFSKSSCAFSVRPDTNASVNGVKASLLVMVVLAAAFKSSETVCRLLPLQRVEELTALSENLAEQLSKLEAFLSELEHTNSPAQELPFMHNTVAFALLAKCNSYQVSRKSLSSLYRQRAG